MQKECVISTAMFKSCQSIMKMLNVSSELGITHVRRRSPPTACRDFSSGLFFCVHLGCALI